MIKIILEGPPVAKKRHRSGTMKGKIYTYDVQKDEKIKNKWLASSQLRQQGLLKPLESPIACSVRTYHLYPKTWSKKRKEREIWKISRPDVDNYLKFYLDVLNGIAYRDDAQIVQLWGEKKYSDIERVEILIKEKKKNG